MLTAIWPSFAWLPNHLPASAGLTTAGMISYFLYWLIQFPLLLIPTHKLQYMFWVKTVLMPPVAIGMVRNARFGSYKHAFLIIQADHMGCNEGRRYRGFLQSASQSARLRTRLAVAFQHD
jgi:cytosine/uracil/thiamine/allantoin permease